MIKKFFKDWAKAFSVCYPMMVQGNLAALTLGHFWKANITGISAAFVALIISILYYDRDWEKCHHRAEACGDVQFHRNTGSIHARSGRHPWRFGVDSGR